MIKTVEAESAELLDKKVNDFMQSKKQNLPVRDGAIYNAEGKILYRAMIFYNEDFSDDKKINRENEPIVLNVPETEYEKKNDRGALWTQKNGEISGNYKGTKIILPLPISKILQDKGFVDIVLSGDKLFITKNKFKKGMKSPDYVILPKKED